MQVLVIAGMQIGINVITNAGDITAVVGNLLKLQGKHDLNYALSATPVNYTGDVKPVYSADQEHIVCNADFSCAVYSFKSYTFAMACALSIMAENAAT